MNVRFKLVAACCTLLVGASFNSELQAQRRPVEVPRLAVMVFKSSEPELGFKVAEEIRERLRSRYSEKQLFVVPVADNNNMLDQSGFDTLEALPPYEENSLSGILRATEYIRGSIDRVGDQSAYRVQASLVTPLGKENIYQPLPVIEEKRLGRALDQLSDAIRDARKQMEGTVSCQGKAKGLATTKDTAGVIAAGRLGIAAYPRATLARVCVMNAQYLRFSGAANRTDSLIQADTALVTVRELLQIDSNNVQGLKMAVDLYRFRGDTAQYLNSLMTLASADSLDHKLLDQIVIELAKSGNSKRAVPFVKSLLDRNPGDPNILRTAFVVYYDAEDYASAVAVGPELIRADTSAADETYYLRMASAYATLQQLQKAVEIYAEASAKFPGNRDFVLQHYKALLTVGQTQQAKEVLKRLAEHDPAASDAISILISLYDRDKMFDSVYIWIEKGSVVASDSLKQIYSNLALRQASIALSAGNKDPVDTVLINRSIRFAQLSHRIKANGGAKLTEGQASMILAVVAANEAAPGKSCPLAQQAGTLLTSAKTSFAAAVAIDAIYEQQISGNKAQVDDLNKAVDSQIKAYCK